MEINVLVVGGIIIVAVLVAMVSILAYKSRPGKNSYVITQEENFIFMSDSIAIQPSNNTIFEDKTVDEVIGMGFAAMKKENYRMLEGVNQDGI